MLSRAFVLGRLELRDQGRASAHPYGPLSVAQVSAGNISEITSKGAALQGTFTRPPRRGTLVTSMRRLRSALAFIDRYVTLAGKSCCHGQTETLRKSLERRTKES